MCIVGVGRPVFIPMIIWDLVLNVYLTALFLGPLMNLSSYKTNSNPDLRIMALRTFIGSAASLMSTIINLTVQVVLDGEHVWLCLMLCNTDGRNFPFLRWTILLNIAVLLNVVVIHWVAHTDVDRSNTNNHYSEKAPLTPRNRDSMPPRELDSKPMDHWWDKATPDSRPSNTSRAYQMPSVDTNENDFLWGSISTVKTHIEAGDGSCGGSIMEPTGIKVKTSHRREESPVPENFMR